MEQTKDINYIIHRTLSKLTLSEREKRIYHIWVMEPMLLVGETLVVCLK